jgi:hypothetical protein
MEMSRKRVLENHRGGGVKMAYKKRESLQRSANRGTELACRLYAGMPTLTQAEANQQYSLWYPFLLADLAEAIEAARRLDEAVPRTNVPWVIECDDGQRLEQREIRGRYQRP